MQADLPPTRVDPERVRVLVEEILARPEYEALAPNPVQRALLAVVEVAGRVLERLYAAAGELSVVGAALVALVAIVVVLLVAAFLRGVRRERRLAAEVAGGGRTAGEWAAEAEGHEQAQRWRDALRCRYGELIAALAQRGLIDEVPGRTAREYLAAGGAALPAARADLEAVTAAFEAAWYGRRAVTAGDVAALRDARERVMAAAQRPLEATLR